MPFVVYVDTTQAPSNKNTRFLLAQNLSLRTVLTLACLTTIKKIHCILMSAVEVISCPLSFEKWRRDKIKRMLFAIPRIWQEPTNHINDCYFYVVDVSHYRKTKTKKHCYPKRTIFNCSSATMSRLTHS